MKITVRKLLPERNLIIVPRARVGYELAITLSFLLTPLAVGSLGTRLSQFRASEIIVLLKKYREILLTSYYVKQQQQY